MVLAACLAWSVAVTESGSKAAAFSSGMNRGRLSEQIRLVLSSR